ncbi:MAG: methylated-DNA--[protein]-cysteine S-methyltransferase [Desulfomonilaceae bacterium]
MNQPERVHHYYSQAVGWMELHVADTGVRSISYITPPSVRKSAEGDPLTAELINEFNGYFAGKIKRFSVPLDPMEGTPFQHKVWDQLLEIPYGEVRSYAEVAKAVGNPRGARAVGLANKRNCIPIVIPCHRVIWANGGLGGYDSGLHLKKILLNLEGVKLNW